MINTNINNAAADLSKTASIFYDRAIFLADTVHEIYKFFVYFNFKKALAN